MKTSPLKISALILGILLLPMIGFGAQPAATSARVPAPLGLSTEPNYNRVQPYRFYVKTRSGKYAAVTGEITIREGLSEGKAGFHAIIYHNPSGSRNLEFDHRKWLNR